MALGAWRAEVLRPVIGQAARLVYAAAANATAGAILLSTALRTLLLGLIAYDPIALRASSLFLTAVAKFAMGSPLGALHESIRASRE
jgi:hypothetical protein